MKTVAKISIVLNLTLLMALVYLWPARQRAGIEDTLALGKREESPALIAAISSSLIVRQLEPHPFRWAQLESADYRTYVKNLRAIGCPEATLHAIVTADVDAVYRQRSRELEQKLDEIDRSSWTVQLSTYQDQQALKTQLQKLPGEEYSEICDLLELKPGPEQQVVVANTPPIARRRQNLSNNPAVMPLVLKKVDLSALNFNDQQIQVINELRQQFLDEIGGANQDPGDPTYRERWQKAQPEIDDNLRGMLGMTAFQDYQVAAQNTENQTAPER